MNDRVEACEPNYKDEYYRLQEKCKELTYENEKLRSAILKLVLKLC